MLSLLSHLNRSCAVETLRGERQVSIPPGIQPGDVITLPYAGVDRLGGSSMERGSLHLTIDIALPSRDQLVQQQVDLLTELRQRVQGVDGDPFTERQQGGSRAKIRCPLTP